MKSMIKIFRLSIFWIIQILIFIGLTLTTKMVLEVIPIPGVFKSLSIIQLDDLNSSVLQSAAVLKTQITGDKGVDSNIIIVDIQGENPLLKRGEIATAIRFLKDNGAKTIALDIALDTSSTHINPFWDSELSKSIGYAKNVIAFNGLVPTISEKNEPDTVLKGVPSQIFDTVLAGIGYANLDPPYSLENPGGVVQYFFPNADYKGKVQMSFPLAVAWNYDSTRAKILKDRAERAYINFYEKGVFKIWELGFLSDSNISQFFKKEVKNKLFIFGYITPENELLQTKMYATPIGKIDYVLVFASIISDILKQKFVQESPMEVDLGLGALICLFNLIFIHFASKKTLNWEKLTGGLLVLAEVFILYFVVMAVYILFEYEISIIMLSIMCFVSVPCIQILKNRIIPAYNKYSMFFKLNKYPYPIVQPYMMIFEPEKRSMRHISTVFGFHKVLRELCALSICAVANAENIAKSANERSNNNNLSESGSEINNQSGQNKHICIPSNQIVQLTDWNDLKEFNLKNNLDEFNKRILDVLNNFKYLDTISNKIKNEYLRLFQINNLKEELFIRVDTEKEIHPYQDTFSGDSNIFKYLVSLMANKFEDYSFIYVTKGEPGNYLIKYLTSSKAPARFIKTQKVLKSGNVYLTKKNEDLFIPLSPYFQYKMCKYHVKRELFIFSEKQYNVFTGKVECNFIGEYFMCNLKSPIKNWEEE